MQLEAGHAGDGGWTDQVRDAASITERCTGNKAPPRTQVVRCQSPKRHSISPPNDTLSVPQTTQYQSPNRHSISPPNEAGCCSNCNIGRNQKHQWHQWAHRMPTRDLPNGNRGFRQPW